MNRSLKLALANKDTQNHRIVAGTKRARQIQSNFGHNKGGIVVPKKEPIK